MVVRWFSQNVLQRVSLYSRRSYIYYLARPRYLLLIEIKTKEWRERQRIMPGAHCPARLSPRPLITAANECDIELATLRLIKLNTLVFAAAVRFNHQIFTCGVGGMVCRFTVRPLPHRWCLSSPSQAWLTPTDDPI